MASNHNVESAFDMHAANSSHVGLAALSQLHHLNGTWVIAIMQRLLEKYQFQTLVFFLSWELQPAYTLLLHDMLHAFSITAHIIITQSGSYRMATYLNVDTLGVILTAGTQDGIMQLTARSLTTVRWLKCLFVILPPSNTRLSVTVAAMSKWLWRMQFLHAALVSLAGNIFIPQPYAKQVLVRSANAWQVEEMFQLSTTNMQGYVLNMPIVHDMPRVFRTQHHRSGVPHQLRGVPAMLLLTFLDHVNATFNDTTADLVGPKTFETLIHLTNANVFETIMNAYTWMQNDDLSMSYPLAINDWCFMVPFRSHTADQLYLFGTFTLYSWLLIMSFSVLLSLVIWRFTPAAQRSRQVAVLQAICLSLFITPMRAIRHSTPSMRLLTTFFFIYGFCMSNLFGTKLASMLTSAPQQPQINSEADVIAADLHLMLTAFEMTHLGPRVSAQFARQLMVVPIGVLDKHRIELNTSYGYSVPSDRWTFISKQQRFRAQPLFRLSHICMGPYYQVYPLQHDSHLHAPLKHFILLMQQNGLLQHWDELAFLDAWVDGLVTMHISQHEPWPLTIPFFRMAWLTWCIGMAASCVAFTWEMKCDILKRLFTTAKGRVQNLARRLCRHK